LLAAHEGGELARCAGLNPGALGEVIHAGAAQSRMADRWLRSRPAPQNGALFDKDLALALELGRELGLELNAAAFVRQRLSEILKI
jgi:3-hydroxyisobutyrate dehydrogenase-like beta-hydroxyacid dehydrogenase